MAHANPFCKSLVVTKETIYEYRDIWAEEYIALTAGNTQWSMGNGATGRIGLPNDSGWELIAMGFQASTHAATAEVIVALNDFTNDQTDPVIGRIKLTDATDGGGVTDFSHRYKVFDPPKVIPDNAVLGFTTISADAGVANARVHARLRRPIGEYITDVVPG